MQYVIQKCPEAESDYQHEYIWSVEVWGEHHAFHFFDRVDRIIARLAVAPHAYPRPVGAKADYRVVPLEGLRIAYHIDDPSNTVTVLALVGRNRYHELEAKVMRAMNDLLQ